MSLQLGINRHAVWQSDLAAQGDIRLHLQDVLVVDTAGHFDDITGRRGIDPGLNGGSFARYVPGTGRRLGGQQDERHDE